jgi:hypothetical protein
MLEYFVKFFIWFSENLLFLLLDHDFYNLFFQGEQVDSVTAKDGDTGSPRPIKVINKGK